MERIIIKCDKCGKDVEKMGESYFTLKHNSIQGYAHFYDPHPMGVISKHHLCEKCFVDNLGLEI